MKISNIAIKPFFRGIKELQDFRENSELLLQDIDSMSTILDYIKTDNDTENTKPSIQTRLKKILFDDVKKVGGENIQPQDRITLNDLKNAYVQLEKEYSFIELAQYGTPREIDRTGEMLDINF